MRAEARAADGETETKILENESRAVNKNQVLSVTETKTATANENVTQPVTNFLRPQDGQREIVSVTNKKSGPAVTDTKFKKTVKSKSRVSVDQVGSTSATNENALYRHWSRSLLSCSVTHSAYIAIKR